MRILICVASALLILSAGVFGDIIKSSSLRASSDGANVVLQWTTEDETNVARFVVERRTGSDGSFLVVASLDAKGPSNYEFIDYSVFKKIATVYEYRVKIVFWDASNPVYVGPITISHSVSGVRRTWGSIKAMFR